MTEFNDYKETKQNLLWEELNLPLLEISFDILNYDFNKHVIPEINENWINKQKMYFENYDDDLSKEAIMLITMKSMKLFNYIIDKNADLSTISESVQELINKFGDNKIKLLTEHIIKYALSSPISENDITIYAGINRKYYEIIKDDDSFISNRFMSASFNKEHANYYSFVGSRGKYAKMKKLPYVVYNITIPKNFNKIFYFDFENQIVFLPHIKFKKTKKNTITKEKVTEITGKRLVKNNVLIENIYYTIDDSYEHIYDFHIDQKIEDIQEDINELDEKIEDLQDDIQEDSDEITDEDTDSEGEDYLQKLDRDVITNFIKEKHPESISHNYEEVKIMTNINRNNNGDIVNDNIHKTLPFLTKYEKARVLGLRAKQINQGANIYVDVPDNIIDGYTIATIELQQKKIPFIIRRPIPNGGSEYWKVSDLELLD